MGDVFIVWSKVKGQLSNVYPVRVSPRKRIFIMDREIQNFSDMTGPVREGPMSSDAVRRSLEQIHIANRELEYAAWQEAYETNAFSEPDPPAVAAELERMRAEWESMKRVVDWGLYRQGLLQEVFRGTSEYEPGTAAVKLAAHRFLQEQDFPKQENKQAA